MKNRPYRTGRTWLSDDQLVLLDVMFDCGVCIEALRRDTFQQDFNLQYGHGLDDAALTCNLRWLCEHGVLSTERRRVFHMTPAGGKLWSEERCPVWERYCDISNRPTHRDRKLMRVLAQTASVRDHALTLLAPRRAHRRVTVVDAALPPWRARAQFHVGIALYEEPRRWTPAEYHVWAAEKQERQAVLEREQSWWSNVWGLQRFIQRHAEPFVAPDRRPQ